MYTRALSLALSLVAGCLVSVLIQPVEAAETKSTEPQYAEEADGVSSLWLQTGPIGWFTERAPLTDLALTTATVGFSHQIGPGRLAWRVTIAHDSDGPAATRFLYADLLSVERLFGTGPLRPFGRVALGFGLDLKGDKLSIGDDGYFNEANGPTGGLGVGAGVGVDLRLGSRVFWRAEASLRAYGGAGRTSVLWDAQTGLGLDI